MTGRIASKLTMNSQCTHWVSVPSPPVTLVQLTESSERRARSFVQLGTLLWFIVYDNINFTFRKFSQRLHNVTEQINATTSAVIALPACFSTTAFKNACSMLGQTRNRGRWQTMTIQRLIPTPEQQHQIHRVFCHAVRSLLLENLHGLTGKRASKLKKATAAEKLTIQLVGGAGEKTNFYPLRALDEEEASVKGTIRVVQRLICDILGFTTAAASSTLRFFVGDWLTIRNLRLVKYIRLTEPEPWGRMGWVQEVAMPFHFQLNAIYMLVRTHLGESDNDASCLDHHRARLRRFKLDKKKPDYHQARELVEHSLASRLLDITRFGWQWFCTKTYLLTACSIRIILKFDTVEQLEGWKPKWREFNDVVHTIVDKYTMVFGAGDSIDPDDDVLKHSKLFIRDALTFWVFCGAIRDEDVGLMWLVYTFWLFMFRGAGCHNYGNEILEMVAQFKYEMDDKLRQITERTWLVNR